MNKDKTLVLMGDMQERLLPAIDRQEAVAQNATRLLKVAGVLSVPVMYTEQYPKGIGATVPEVLSAMPDGASRFEKMSFSCCGEPGFTKAFQACARSLTVVFGIETHICVLSTIQDLRAREHNVALVADASGSRDRQNHDLAVAAARDCGVLVVPTETVVYQLLGRAGTPEFKSLLPLFK
jgi:nicotinamidase-related amidase